VQLDGHELPKSGEKHKILPPYKKYNLGIRTRGFAIQSPHLTIRWAQCRHLIALVAHKPRLHVIEQQIGRTTSQNDRRCVFRAQGLWLRMGQNQVAFGDFESLQ
jgi:hypothetical protein